MGVNRLRKDSRRRRGLSLIEMVLVMPILLLLTFGVIEYGGLFWRLQQVENAARQGARNAALAYSSTASARARIDQLMADAGLQSTGYTVTFDPADPGAADTGTLVSARVTVPYVNISLTRFPLIPVPSQLSRKVVMSKEGA